MPSSAVSSADRPLPTIDDIRAAAERIKGKAVLTPLLESPPLNARLGGRLLVKAEALQRTGSFKFRGAYNTLVQFDERQRRGGVVTYSSGNHAQGVAAAAQLLGIPATIVMPADAPQIKIANTKGYGAEVVLYDRYKESREEVGAKIARERGATIVAPYDEPQVIAGQGTAGLEIAAQAKAMGATLDAVIVCCGGGGLTAGCRAGDQQPSARAHRSIPPSPRASTIPAAPWRRASGSATIPRRARSATRCWRRRRAPSPSRSTAASSRAASPSATPRCAAPWRPPSAT